MTQQRDWQKDMELAHTARYEYDVRHLNGVLDALFYWLQEANKWRDEALRQYPTPEAYEAACAALEKHRARADAAEAREQRLMEVVEWTRNQFEADWTYEPGIGEVVDEILMEFDKVLNPPDDGAGPKAIEPNAIPSVSGGRSGFDTKEGDNQ